VFLGTSKAAASSEHKRGTIWGIIHSASEHRLSINPRKFKKAANEDGKRPTHLEFKVHIKTISSKINQS
jgi:hypothetical protein